ncbi:MAG: universal stress protein [Gammaproteobacteria bacterium]
MATYRKILVAVDLSPEARAVLARACELRVHYRSELHLIHVVEPIVLGGDYDLVPVMPVEIEETLLQRAKGFLGTLVGEMNIADVRQIVEVGSVKHEILRFAEEQDCDLIVIGAHGRHGVATLLGSTANAVLHGTKCDVLCVRLGE